MPRGRAAAKKAAVKSSTTSSPKSGATPGAHSKTSRKKEISPYRHQDKRKNNPEVGLAAFEKPVKEPPRVKY